MPPNAAFCYRVGRSSTGGLGAAGKKGASAVSRATLAGVNAARPFSQCLMVPGETLMVNASAVCESLCR